MADAWDYGPGNRDDVTPAFSLTDYVSSFTKTVTSLLGSAAEIKGAAQSTGLVSGNQTRTDTAQPVAKDRTVLYLILAVGVVYLYKRG